MTAGAATKEPSVLHAGFPGMERKAVGEQVGWPKPAYPAQQESLATSFSKPSAASFNPSTVVR